jgi:hypothetical protein
MSSDDVLGYGFWIVLVLVVLGWHTDYAVKARYAMKYDTSTDKVTLEDKPINCDFWTAPMGNKGCHYDRQALVNDDKQVTVYYQRMEGD